MMSPSIQTTVEGAFKNYTAALEQFSQPEKPEPPKRPFEYGQAIYVVEGGTIHELTVYGYDRDRVYAVRANGVRTSASRAAVIWTTREGAEHALSAKGKRNHPCQK